MDIMKYKYKAHKFVNTMFYFVVFAIGFILGLFLSGLTKVSAFTIEKYNGIEINEEFVYNAFSSLPDFDIDTYSNILCMASGSYHRCIAFNPSHDIRYRKSGSIREYYSYSEEYDYFVYDWDDNDLFHFVDHEPGSIGYVWSYQNFSDFVHYSNGKSTGFYTNFNIKYNESALKSTELSDIDKINSAYNVLDFSNFVETELTYDSTLFDNDPNFKKVCVNADDRFLISTDECIENDSGYCTNTIMDFIWFKHGVTGISTYLYDTYQDNNVLVFDEDTPLYSEFGYWYWFNSKSEIDKYFDVNTVEGALLDVNGYTDKYSYYDYTAHPFISSFSENIDGNSPHQIVSNVFWFKNKGITHDIECLPGNNGSYNDTYWECVNGRIVEYPSEYCFYLKKEYTVNILNKDGLGDDMGVVVTPWGDEDVHTTLKVDSLDNKSFISKVRLFLDKISSTINFINSNIYDFYISMPFLVQMFILSLLTILFIKLIIDMILR